MKLLVGLALLAVFGSAIAADTCDISVDNAIIAYKNLPSDCGAKVINQIKREVRASYRYFQMGAYFASDQVNLPGFSELFFKAAKEERDHSATLMDYLSTRLTQDTDVTAIQTNLLHGNIEDDTTDADLDIANFSGLAALQEAFKMEQTITQKIKEIIGTCDKDGDKTKDYHVSDFLTGDFLTEQYESERNFGGKVATLQKMWEHHGSVAEFMFDKTL